MFTRFVVAAALLIAPLAVACGSGDDTKNDSSDLITSNGEGTLGAQCGGFAGVPCAQGFECVTQGGWADAIGTCEPALTGGEGATCGGIAALKCNEGLTCKKTSQTVDATGTCTKPVVSCQAVPGCNVGDKKVDSCPRSASCYTRTLCGTTITCAK